MQGDVGGEAVVEECTNTSEGGAFKTSCSDGLIEATDSWSTIGRSLKVRYLGPRHSSSFSSGVREVEEANDMLDDDPDLDGDG